MYLKQIKMKYQNTDIKTLKLVRTNIYYRFTIPPYFLFITFCLCNYFPDECHAWFHLYGRSQTARNAKQATDPNLNSLAP